MGIEVHGFNLLKFAAARKRFGRVATIGRQGLHVPKEKVRRLLDLPREIDFGPWCEDLLTSHFGASSVESFDNSDYEQATHIVDLNLPLTQSFSYDTVIDLGCLEHIYNAPQALKNISLMGAEDAQILHLLPANNQCGHGFWQFSPELFFSLYSEANGYRETQVFLADSSNEYCWYEVRKPANGDRVEFTSIAAVYVLVRTKKASLFCHDRIQQSDYVHIWENGGSSPVRNAPAASFERLIKQAAGRLPFESAARFAYKQVRKALPSRTRLSGRNPNLTRKLVSDLVG